MSNSNNKSPLHNLSQSSRGRDSRVVSIYDKYLYDPKDLESSDPRRRELARQASRLRLQGKTANVNEANGQQNPMTGQRKSISFAQGTKSDAKQAAPMPNNRDSGAFGLGLGMLGGGGSDSESDSDDERAPRRGAAPASRLDRLRQDQAPGLERQDSWSQRAAAVGQRPPDTASQNPPSLKVMGLKSAKMGGLIPPAPRSGALQRQQEGLGQELDRGQRVLSSSEYGDHDSRHGSAIGFTPPVGLGAPRCEDSHTQSNGGRPISPRTALAKQLGLANPFQDQSGGVHSPPMAVRDMPSPGSGPVRMPIPQQQQQREMPGPGPRSPGFGPGGPGNQPMMSRAGPPPSGQPHMLPNVLQRGPSPPHMQHNGQGPQPPRPAMLSAPGPGGPSPISPRDPLPGYGQGPTQQQSPTSGPDPNSRGGPQPRMGSGFSDTPGPQKRQSVFRKSMAFITGGPQGGPPGPNQGRGQGPPSGQKRQSLFRRSMAMLGAGTRQQAPTPQQDAPPRVHGFQDDSEKPDHARKPQFLGDGGAGFEWDADGRGAKFWRRFSMAQNNEHTQKLEAGSKAWQEQMKVGKRKLIVISVIALTIIVGIIVGVITWREIISPSGKENDMPRTTFKGDFGGTDVPPGETLSWTSGAATSTAGSGSGWLGRAAPPMHTMAPRNLQHLHKRRRLRRID